MIGANSIFNIPPYTSIIEGKYSEFYKTENKPDFAKFWNASSSFDVIKNWENIKEIRNALRPMYPAKCSKCGKDCEVPFKPDPGRPVDCQDCHKKTR